MAGEIERWWGGLPLITRWLFTLSFVLTVGAHFGFIPPNLLVLNFAALTKKFEIWRLVTPFLFHGRLGFPFLINMIFLIRYGSSVERDTFMNEPADYLWMLILGGLILLIPGYFVPLSILGMALKMMIIYYWSRKNPNIGMTFMFGFRFQAFYFPWVLIGFRFLLGGSPIAEICGVIAGHIYYFFADILPASNGRRYIVTPQFLKDWLPGSNHNIPAPGEGPRQPGFNWGRGHTLGVN